MCVLMSSLPASVTCKCWVCVKLLLLAIRLSLMKAEKLMSDETCSVLFLMCGMVWCCVVLSCCPRWQQKSRGLAACLICGPLMCEAIASMAMELNCAWAVTGGG